MLIRREVLVEMRALIGIEALMNKNTFEGGHLFVSKERLLELEDAKSNNYCKYGTWLWL